MKRTTNKILILTFVFLISVSSISLFQNVKGSTTIEPKIGDTPIIDGVIDLQNNEWDAADKSTISLYQNLSAPANGLLVDLWVMQDQTSLFISIQFELEQHSSSEYNEEFLGLLISEDEVGDYNDARIIQFSNISSGEFQYLDYYINNSLYILDDNSNGEGAANLEGDKITYEYGTPIEINDDSNQDIYFQTKFSYNFSIVYGKSPLYPEGILIENNFLIEIQFPPYNPPGTPDLPKIVVNTIIFGIIGGVFIYYVNSIRKIRDKVKRLRR